MKRLIALSVTVVLVFTLGSSLAEQSTGSVWDLFGAAQATATPAPNAFRFRDGIRWGMNTEQVKALEMSPMTERSQQNLTVMFSDGKVVVSRFTADLVFMFREDRLMMASYEFQQGSPDAFLYLSGALSYVYGEKAEAEPLKIKVLMDAFNPNRYKTELITQAAAWTAADGTSVFLYYYGEQDFAITYVSPELGNRMYNVTGL